MTFDTIYQVSWGKSALNEWHRLSYAMPNSYIKGVYIIWCSITGKVIRVGQGDIAARLDCHKRDTEIQQYNQYNQLVVTWAQVEPSILDNVEAFLGRVYDPLVSERFPNVAERAVNLP